MTTQTETLKLALEAHRKNESHRTVAETRYWCDQYKLLAQQAIEALAQPEQEPVAFICQGNLYMADNVDKYCTAKHTPLYTKEQL